MVRELLERAVLRGGVVAVGGGWGTLSEIALACRRGTPVVALDSWLLEDAADRTGRDPVLRVPSAEIAIRAVLGILGARS